MQLRTGILALMLVLCAAPALAVGEPTLAGGERARGVQLAREGRCEAALPELAAARAQQPADAELAGLAGQCQLRLLHYPEAIASFEAALASDPTRADYQLGLAKARYHLGDREGAETALARASALEGDAEYQLYLGMLRLQQGDADAAVAALERARTLDARRVEPVASYYLGQAQAMRGEKQQASESLRRVADDWSGTDWSNQATLGLERLERGAKRQFWGSVGAGVEYDSNVVLRGRGAPLPEDISDDDDVRGVWTGNLGGELWKNDDTALGLMGSYRGTTHAELDEFDVQFPSATLWLDRDLSETLRARVRYDFGYAWLDGDSFVMSNGGLLSLMQSWSRSVGRSEIYGQAFVDEYFFSSDDVPDFGSPGCVGVPCGPPGLDEEAERERDGWGGSAGLTHYWPLPTGSLPLSRAELRGGYRYTGFDAQGREYSFDSHELHAGFAVTLPAAVALDLSGGYSWRPYRHASTFPDPNALDNTPNGAEYPLSNLKRRENTGRFELGLARAFGDYVTLAAHYRYLDNRSNTDVFDYDQHVVGVSITLGLTKEL